MLKVSASLKFYLRDLHQWVVFSKKLLVLYTSDNDMFCHRLVSGDEAWLHH